ncbi:MAG: hypothetical protein A3A80_02115 [Candidatus Terrybacteria bacterium RIFCSPLOWO2_01_FULL_44_24]|uniref:VWFA domain-containing protein n=1 Tax=Candidatus Terrybacteria bacterium RIFCSPHIGHO2_01_FULL_43_35 TaxID=1802361 RepID=A0A1G2PEA1_9BACT|nr:MAG: hypothetical protein A2828_01905 [Candidatus Terrybacteria bacterium RIFCSPHIGHO2_01_FULL_43_35]OHA50875.1 MAG: hypothetical protein A3A80_02115 [Candidatus Terrybacteria bacterium RIFCSPLOWO2_01_FULL_44_24]
MTLLEPHAFLLILLLIPFVVVLVKDRAFKISLGKKIGFSQEPKSLSIRGQLILGLVFISAMATGLAQPQINTEKTVKSVPARSDVQIMFAVDLSASMAGSKQADSLLRIDRAKDLIREVAGELPGIPIAVYAFTNITVPQVPFTTSFSTLDDMLNVNLVAGSLQKACTNRDNCSEVWQAMYRLPTEFTPKTQKKIIVVISDGDIVEPHTPDSIRYLKNQSIKVFAVNIGDNSEHIWLRDKKTRQVTGYDPKPLLVYDTELRYLASETGGQFFTENNAENLAGALKDVIGQGPVDAMIVVKVYENISAPFFLIAILALLAYFTLYIERIDVFNPFRLIGKRISQKPSKVK